MAEYLDDDGLITDDDAPWRIDLDDLEFGEVLGTGAFGSVYRGVYLGTDVAIKKIVEEDPDCLLYLEREVNVLKAMTHPNVVQLIGVCADESGLYIVTEWVQHGDLRKFLKNLKVEMIWKLRIKIANDVAKAMAFLHSRNVIHRDIKSKNLLVDDNWRVKICDFGFARSAAEAERPMTLCGTDDWMAPEVILGMPYGKKADVFSFGIVLAEIITRRKITTDLQRSPMEAFGLNVEKFRGYVPADCPEDFAALVEECCAYEPADRPEFKRIIKRLQTIYKSLSAVPAKAPAAAAAAAATVIKAPAPSRAAGTAKSDAAEDGAKAPREAAERAETSRRAAAEAEAARRAAEDATRKAEAARKALAEAEAARRAAEEATRKAEAEARAAAVSAAAPATAPAVSSPTRTTGHSPATVASVPPSTTAGRTPARPAVAMDPAKQSEKPHRSVRWGGEHMRLRGTGNHGLW